MKTGGSDPLALDGRTRLILAAEKLFAKEGIASASLRQIATEAGLGNHTAVQYHFGSREGIVKAIVMYRNQQMELEREKMLAVAEARGTEKDIKTLIEIIILPQLSLVDVLGNHSYASFICQYLLKYQSNRFGDFGVELSKNLATTLKLLRERILYLPEHIAQRRLVTACFMFLNILSAYTYERRSNALESFENALDDTIDQIVVAISMPLHANEHAKLKRSATAG